MDKVVRHLILVDEPRQQSQGVRDVRRAVHRHPVAQHVVPVLDRNEGIVSRQQSHRHIGTLLDQFEGRCIARHLTTVGAPGLTVQMAQVYGTLLVVAYRRPICGDIHPLHGECLENRISHGGITEKLIVILIPLDGIQFLHTQLILAGQLNGVLDIRYTRHNQFRQLKRHYYLLFYFCNKIGNIKEMKENWLTINTLLNRITEF